MENMNRSFWNLTVRKFHFSHNLYASEHEWTIWCKVFYDDFTPFLRSVFLKLIEQTIDATRNISSSSIEANAPPLAKISIWSSVKFWFDKYLKIGAWNISLLRWILRTTKLIRRKFLISTIGQSTSLSTANNPVILDYHSIICYINQ